MSKSIDLIQPDRGQSAIAIHLVNKDGFAEWAKKLTKGQRASLDAQKFDGGGYQVGIVPDGDGWFAVGGVADPGSLSSWCMAKLAESLPEGTYRRADGEPGPALFGWQTAQYRFTRYRDDEKAQGPRVLLTKDAKAIEPTLDPRPRPGGSACRGLPGPRTSSAHSRASSSTSQCRRKNPERPIRAISPSSCCSRSQARRSRPSFFA